MRTAADVPGGRVHYGRRRGRASPEWSIGCYQRTAILALTGAMTFIAGRIARTHISLGLVIAGSTGVWPLALFFAGVSALASGVLHGASTRPRSFTF